jgi:hypothetical protein
MEPQVGGEDFQLLPGGGTGGDTVALAHDAALGAVSFEGYVVCG